MSDYWKDPAVKERLKIARREFRMKDPGFQKELKRQERNKKRRLKRRKSDRFYNTRAWLKLRYESLKKYGRQCMLCKATNGVMHVDHIKPRSRYPELALDPENLQVLCKACNLGKSDHSEDDWR